MLLIPSEDHVDLELLATLSETQSSQDEESLQRRIFLLLTRGDQDDGEGDNNNDNGRDDETEHLHVRRTLLLRPTQDRPGLVAWHLPTRFWNTADAIHSDRRAKKNRRATCLAMTCGLWRQRCRFHGPVLVDFQRAPGANDNNTAAQYAESTSLLRALHQVAEAGAVYSPDDRLWKNINPTRLADDDASCFEMVRSWILQATRENYHDQETVQRWAQITTTKNRRRRGVEEEEEDSSSSDRCDDDEQDGPDESEVALSPNNHQVKLEFVTQEPLCVHCRRPTSNLCEGCRGAYFCPAPRTCRQEG